MARVTVCAGSPVNVVTMPTSCEGLRPNALQFVERSDTCKLPLSNEKSPIARAP